MIKNILKIKGAKIGKNFKCENFPKIKLIDQKHLNLIIGNNVTISGKIEIKLRNNSEILIKDNTKIDHGVRIIVANKSKFSLGSNSKVMMNSNINCGADVTIGNFTGLSANTFLTSSSHMHIKNKNYMETKYIHKKIYIGNNVQIGAFCFISPGSIINDNVVISPLSYVYGSLKSGYIFKGNPVVKVGAIN